jgi:hypothetical protein
MNDLNRYMLIIIGASNGIDKDLNFIADSERGIDFVESKLLFLGTFYSPYTTHEIHEKLAHRPAMLLFDITDETSYGVNLPTKYYTGLFPEVGDIIKNVYGEETKAKRKGRSKAKSRATTKTKKIEEYDTIDDILDKLSRNQYDRSCLTENELSILNSQNND